MFHTDPVLGALLLAVLLVAGSFQKTLGPRLRWPPHVRRRLLPWAERNLERAGRFLSFSVRPLTTEMTHEADEYICSVKCSYLELLIALFRHGGYRWNLAATLKFLVIGGERVYERFSLAHRTALRAKYQHHVFGFPAAHVEPYSLHLGGHKEINWMWSPAGHTGHGDDAEPQQEGDPDGRLVAALDDAGIEYDVLAEPWGIEGD